MNTQFFLQSLLSPLVGNPWASYILELHVPLYHLFSSDHFFRGGRWQGRVGAIPNPQPPKKE